MSLAVLPDGRLASGSYDETIRIWDVATLQEVGCLEGGHISGIDKLVPLPGNRLASGDAEWNDLMLWDLTTNSMIGDIETVAGVSVTIATAAPDGRIALGLHDGAIRLINPDTCVLSESLRGHTRAVSAICPLFDGRIASAGYDHTVRIWDIVDLAEVACHQLDFVADDLAAHPDGRLIAGNTNRGCGCCRSNLDRGACSRATAPSGSNSVRASECWISPRRRLAHRRVRPICPP